MSAPEIPAEIYERAEILMDQFRHIEDDRELIARVLMEVGQGAHAEPTRFGLTAQQIAALAFLEGQCAGRGRNTPSPSLRELAGHLEVSLSHAHSIVRALQERGFVRSLPGRARSISIVGRA